MTYNERLYLAMEELNNKLDDIWSVEEYRRIKSEIFNKYNVFNDSEFHEIFSYEY